jgi:2-dehydro-3-deoxygalactonokinase
MTRPGWIAVDWGTSTLRAWAMGPEGAFAATQSAKGMGVLKPEGFEPALLEIIGPWLPADGAIDVLVAGMAGARQGWAEAPYVPVPCPPLDAARLVAPPVQDARMRVRILHGLSQARPADVMRGEETQIAGLLAREPGFEGVAVLPGTHCKWAALQAGEVTGFATVMSGELFALLAGQSVLRHSVAAEGLAEGPFLEALDDVLAAPQGFAARLFPLRAEALLQGLDPLAARSRLSGLVIGMELAATRPWWLGRRVALVAGGSLAAAYAAALAHVGAPAAIHDPGDLILAGLGAAYAASRSSTN